MTDTYSNKIQSIYNNTYNYLILNKQNSESLIITDVKIKFKGSYKYYTECFFNAKTNELKIYTTSPSFKKILIHITTEEGLDSILLQVIPPFDDFKINISKESLDGDTLDLKYGKSIFVNLQINDNYKHLTKSEENIYLLSTIFWKNNQYPVIVRKSSYYKYELLFLYDIFRYKDFITTEVILSIYPYILINKREPEPILHRSVNYVVKIE